MARKGPKSRQRDQIEELPSGALRIKVYAGIDPLSGYEGIHPQPHPATARQTSGREAGRRNPGLVLRHPPHLPSSLRWSQVHRTSDERAARMRSPARLLKCGACLTRTAHPECRESSTDSLRAQAPAVPAARSSRRSGAATGQRPRGRCGDGDLLAFRGGDCLQYGICRPRRETRRAVDHHGPGRWWVLDRVRPAMSRWWCW